MRALYAPPVVLRSDLDGPEPVAGEHGSEPVRTEPTGTGTEHGTTEPAAGGHDAHSTEEQLLHAGHGVEGGLHIAHNSLDVAEGLLGGISRVMVLPAVAYFGTSFLTRDYERGDALATSLGLSATALTTAFFVEKGIEHPATGILERHNLLNGKLFKIVQKGGRFLERAVPLAVFGVGAGEAAIAVATYGGPQALLDTQEGRTGILHAVGGALLLIRTRKFQFAGAVPLLTAVANDFGAFQMLDRAGAPAGGLGYKKQEGPGTPQHDEAAPGDPAHEAATDDATHSETPADTAHEETPLDPAAHHAEPGQPDHAEHWDAP